MKVRKQFTKNKKYIQIIMVAGVAALAFVSVYWLNNHTDYYKISNSGISDQLASSQGSLVDQNDSYENNSDTLELASASGNIVVTKNVEYAQGKVDGGYIPLLMDVYQPDAACGKKKRPVVLMIHGGGFENGARDTRPYRRLGQHFAEEGYFAASIDYRLMGDNPVPPKKFARKLSKLDPAADPELVDAIASAFKDTIDAIDYLEINADEYCINPKRMALLGDSAGAITALAATYSFDDLRFGRQGVDVVIDLWGAIGNPSHIEGHEAEIFIIHGTADKARPYSEALAIEARAKKIGLPIEFYAIEEGGHGFDAIDIFSFEVGNVTLIDRIVDFLNTYL